MTDIQPQKKVSRRELLRTVKRLLGENQQFYAFVKRSTEDLEKIHKIAFERHEALPESLLLPNTKKAKIALYEIAEISAPYTVEIKQEDVKKLAEDPPTGQVIKFEKGAANDNDSPTDRRVASDGERGDGGDSAELADGQTA